MSRLRGIAPLAVVVLLLGACSKAGGDPKALPLGSPSAVASADPSSSPSPSGLVDPSASPTKRHSPKPSSTPSVSPTSSPAKKLCPDLPKSGQPPADLELKVEPSRQEMRQGEDMYQGQGMQVKLTLKNNSLQKGIKYAWQDWFINGLVKDGSLVGGDNWSGDVRRPAGWRNRTLGPLMSQTFTFHIDSLACASSVSGAPRPPLPAGVYEVVAPVMSEEEGTKWEWWWYAPKVTITILP